MIESEIPFQMVLAAQLEKVRLPFFLWLIQIQASPKRSNAGITELIMIVVLLLALEVELAASYKSMKPASS